MSPRSVAVDPAFGVRLRELREQRGLSLRRLAQLALSSKSHLQEFEAGRKMPQADTVARLDAALDANGTLIGMVDPHARPGLAIEESRRLADLFTGQLDADELLAEAEQLAVDYLAEPAPTMHLRAASLRQKAVRALQRAHRPATVADLTVAIGRASGVLAYAALDTGDPQAALVHAQAALGAAQAAGHPGLRAWTRGTQSLIARFRGDFPAALDYAEDGLREPGPGTGEVRLLCGVAHCQANLGDASATYRALAAAEAARDRAGTDAGGIFGFSVAKQAYYSGSALIWLPKPVDAKDRKSVV